MAPQREASESRPSVGKRNPLLLRRLDSETDRNVFMRRSLDNGATWEEQVQISEPGWYCNNADRAFSLSTGRVILPAHGPYAENYIGGTRYRGGNLHSFVFYSDDGFRTWKRSSNSMTAKGRGCHEPTIVELKDGRLLCLMRNTNRCQYSSISVDGGDHWTTPVPTVLESPESPAIVKRIPTSGDLLVLWNNVASSSNWPRTPLTAAISRDEGKTWTNFRDIDNRPDYDAAYPSVTFVGDEALITYYSRPHEVEAGCRDHPENLQDRSILRVANPPICEKGEKGKSFFRTLWLGRGVFALGNAVTHRGNHENLNLQGVCAGWALRLAASE